MKIAVEFVAEVIASFFVIYGVMAIVDQYSHILGAVR